MRVPTLAEVAQDRALLDGLPVDALIELGRLTGHLDADIRAAVSQRQMVADRSHPGPGDVLDVAAAAARLGTSEDSLYRKHRRLGLGYKDPLDGRLKFTAQEIADYIKRQHRP